METIQDALREEARDYQELARYQYIHIQRIIKWQGEFEGDLVWLDWAREYDNLAHFSLVARSTLFELIGAEPEWDGPWLCEADLAQ